MGTDSNQGNPELSSGFWEDPKVFESKRQTMRKHRLLALNERINALVAQLQKMPEDKRHRAVCAIEALMVQGTHLFESKGPADTPTYVRGSQ